MSVYTAADAARQLPYANTVRIERARVKRDLNALGYREGVAAAAEMVLHPPEHCGRMPVVKLLEAVHMLGRQRVAHMLRSAQVHERVTLEAMTQRQRTALSRELRRKS